MLQNDNQDGFGLEQSAYADYVKFLASTAAANNLAIGLKNSLDLIPDVIDVIQFAVNEQCHDYDECDKYKPLTEANKAVFNIEYGGDACSSPDGVDLSILIKNKDQALDALGGACKTNGGGSQPASPTPAASQSAVAEASSVPAPAQTPTSAVPAVTPTGGSPAVKPSSTANAEATPAPSAGAGEEEGDNEEGGGDDENEDGSADEGDENDEDDEDEDEEEDEEDEDEEDAKPWWHRHQKHE